MAQNFTPTPNSYVHSFGSNNYINVNFISMDFYSTQNNHHHHHRPPNSWSRHSILTFTAAALVNLLQLKYQGNNESPFETHSITMFLAVASLFLYFLAYDAKSRFTTYVNVRVCRIMMGFLGPLSLAALFSVLLPQFLCPILFLLSIFYSLSEFPLSIFFEFWKWIRETIWWAESFPRQQHQQQGRLTRLIRVHPMRPLENVIVDEYEMYSLPV